MSADPLGARRTVGHAACANGDARQVSGGAVATFTTITAAFVMFSSANVGAVFGTSDFGRVSSRSRRRGAVRARHLHGSSGPCPPTCRCTAAARRPSYSTSSSSPCSCAGAASAAAATTPDGGDTWAQTRWRARGSSSCARWGCCRAASTSRFSRRCARGSQGGAHHIRVVPGKRRLAAGVDRGHVRQLAPRSHLVDL